MRMPGTEQNNVFLPRFAFRCNSSCHWQAAQRRKIEATRFGKGGRLKPPMKMTAKHFFVIAALALGLVLPLAAQNQSDENVPSINFQTVPITMAIQNLAQQANINFIIDPKLFAAADGTMKPEPTLTRHWQNCTAANALARVLNENHLLMVTKRSPRLFASPAQTPLPARWTPELLGNDTNGVIPMIRFEDVPLDIALKDAHRSGPRQGGA